MIDYNSILNKNVLNMQPSGIRKFFDIAAEMDDVISLGVGEPDFQTPWHIRQAGITALEEGKTRYTSNWGSLELRREISNYLSRRFKLTYSPTNEIIVTVGGSEAIDCCLRAVISPGDEVIVPEPSFVCYTPIVSLCGGVPVPLVTKVEDKFKLTLASLKAVVTEKTKVLVLPFPNNPTGAIMTSEDLLAITDFIKERNIFVLSDEIYAELTFTQGRHVSIAELDGMRERTVVISGFSKSYSMTGWRLGYAAGPAEIIEQMLKIHQFAIMCSPSISQHAGVEALKNGDRDIVKMASEYDMRRRYIVKGFNDIGLSCFEPEGAFYCFPSIASTGMSSDTFCERLLMEKQVAVVPGNAFGECGAGFIRVSYCYSIDHIKEALRRISEFLSEQNN